jgi:hypothetical protein
MLSDLCSASGGSKAASGEDADVAVVYQDAKEWFHAVQKWAMELLVQLQPPSRQVFETVTLPLVMKCASSVLTNLATYTTTNASGIKSDPTRLANAMQGLCETQTWVRDLLDFQDKQSPSISLLDSQRQSVLSSTTRLFTALQRLYLQQLPQATATSVMGPPPARRSRASPVRLTSYTSSSSSSSLMLTSAELPAVHNARAPSSSSLI